MKTIKSLEDSGALIKAVTETIVNQIKEQIIIGMLLSTLGDSLLENMLRDKGPGKAVIGAGYWTI